MISIRRLARQLIVLLSASIAAQAHAFQLLGTQWTEAQTSMYADFTYESGTSPSGTSWNDAFGAAADAWSNASVFQFEVIEERSHPCAGLLQQFPEDGFRNGVGFYPTDCGLAYGAGTLAVTTTYSANAVTSETDITFNSNEAWDIYNGPWRADVADFRRVAAHELGHVVGLDHEFFQVALMDGFLTPGDVIEAPTVDDLNGVAALYGNNGGTEPLLLTLEEPADDAVKTGVANVRGWAVGVAQIARVEFFIDDVYQGNIPLGGNRPDVAAQFGQYPASLQSGFSLAFNYNNLDVGTHRMLVRAVDAIGRVASTEVDFTVARFHVPFISDAGQVSLEGAGLQRIGDRILIEDLEAAGRLYDVLLQWMVPTQDFDIISVHPASP